MKLYSFYSLLTLSALLLSPALSAYGDQLPFNVIKDVPYKISAGISPYEQERCRLDLYLPTDRKEFSTLVWFHGGGLTAGSKDEGFTLPIVRSLASSGIAIAAVNYRLSPKATYPAYVEDGAAAVAWVHAHITEHGGDAGRVFVGGHSAGGYLAAILAMDGRHLQKVGLKSGDVAGFIPVSGQLLTHYTIREERKEGRFEITADDSAPIHYARKNTPPLLVLYADHDMPTRREENEFFVSVLRATGNRKIEAQMIADRTHGSIASSMANPGDPAKKALLDFMKTK